MRGAASGSAAFEVTLGRLGRFPERGRPAVIWLGSGQGAEQLEGLAARVRGSLLEQGLPFDDKPFHAHVTLARVDRDAGPKDERLILAALRAAPPPDLRFRADVVHVVESTLSPKGPRYSSLETIPLARSRDG